MITATAMHAVWKSTDDYSLGLEPIAVCVTEESAWAVYNLLNPRMVNGFSRGPYPVKDVLYIMGTRGALREDRIPVPTSRYDCWDEDGRRRKEAARDDEAARQRRLGYYA